MPDLTDDVDEIVKTIIKEALRELEDAHEYAEQNPTFSRHWGAPTTNQFEFPRMPEGSEMGIEGECEFWYKYGQYVGMLHACMTLEQMADASWPSYSEMHEELGAYSERTDDLPTP